MTEGFAAADVQRSHDFSVAMGTWAPWTLLAQLMVLLLVAVVLARQGRVAAARPVTQSRRIGRVLLAAAGLSAVLLCVRLPAAWHSSQVLRRFGITVQPWPQWWRDQLVSFGIGIVLTAAGLLAFWWLWRTAPRSWPYWAALGAAVLVVLGSLVVPVLISPLFEKTHPLPDGPLRARIETLAAEHGMADAPILVSDASSRTRAYNANVSGLGPTQRVVLYDNLVRFAEQDEDAVMSVVAHEMGHAERYDVLRGTTLGAVGAAFAVLVLGLLSTTARGEQLLARRDVSMRATATLVASMLLVTHGAQLLAAPATNLISRRIEARTDVYALNVTRDPEAFARMWHEMVRAGASRLDPAPWWHTALYATHPSAPWRLGQAEEWARLHGVTPQSSAS